MHIQKLSLRFWRRGQKSAEPSAAPATKQGRTHQLKMMVGIATILATAVIGVVAFARSTPVNATAGINEQINYQGRLLTSTGAVVPDGSYNMEFKIVKGGDGCNPTSGTFPCSGTTQWTETRESGNKVLVKNGYFSVYLGSVTAFASSVDWNDDTLWIAINIGGTGSPSYDGVMKPLTRLSSTPYALNSKYLGGLDKTSFVQLGQGSVQSVNVGTSAVAVNQQGAGNLLQLQSGGSDAFLISSAGDQSFGNNANHTLNVAARSTNAAGRSLTVAGGAGGSGASGVAGGALILQGGAAAGTSGNANGGDITLDGGAAVNSGTKGNVILQGAGGNVGIGTSGAPSQILSVGGSTGNFTVASTGAVVGVGINSGSGLLQGTGGLTLTGAVSVTNNSSSTLGLNTGSSTGQITLGGGSAPLQIDSTNFDVSTAGALSGITTISTSSTINSQTISSTANFTGTVGVATSVTTPLVTSSGALAVTGGTTLALSSTGSNAVSLDTGSAAAINIGATSGSTMTYGNTTNSTHTFKTNNTAASFQIQNASSNNVFSVDTSATAGNNMVILGKASTLDGKLLFKNATNSNGVTIVSGATAAGGGSGYTLTLPTALGSSGDCLKDTNGSGVLGFGSCGTGGSVTIGTIDSQTKSANGAVVASSVLYMQTADGTYPGLVSTGTQTLAGAKTFTSALTIQTNSSNALNITDSSGNNGLQFSTSSNANVLKIFGNAAGATNYLQLYYDNATSTAYIAASTGTTQIGSGAASSGNINLILNAAADQLLTSKAISVSANYSTNDFKFTRGLTGTSYTLGGNVFTIADESTLTTGSSAPNVLYIDQHNTGATGNLILAQTGGSTDKFKVTSAGALTLAAGVSIGSGNSYTGSGAVTVDSASGTTLSIGTGANAHNVTIGNTTSTSSLTLNAGSGGISVGASTVTGTGALTLDTATGNLVLKAGGTTFVTADATNTRVQFGSSTTDATAILTVLDSYNTTDPGGVNGAMYYSTNSNKFRCYENSAWKDCITAWPSSTLASDTSTTSSTAYTTAFSYTPPASKNVRIDFYPIVKSDVSGVAVQYRVSSADAGNVGNCLFQIPAGANTLNPDQVAIGSAPADTGDTAILNTSPFSIIISCAFTSDSSPGAILLEFQSETGTTNTVWTLAGSYYTVVTN